MASKPVNLEEIQKLINIAENYGLDELTVSEGDISITVRGLPMQEDAAGEEAVQQPRMMSIPRRKRAAASALAPTANRHLEPLTSPMTGVFYRAATPDAPPFVDIGQQVEVGQTVGLIEAMKVFSEIPSSASGRVIEILIENGKLVQADEPIMYLEPAEGGEELA